MRIVERGGGGGIMTSVKEGNVGESRRDEGGKGRDYKNLRQ